MGQRGKVAVAPTPYSIVPLALADIKAGDHTHTHTRTRGITQVSRRSDRETKAAIRAYTTEKRVAGLWLVTHWVSHGEGGGREGGGGVGDRFASSFGALSDCVKRKLTRSSSSVFRLCCSVRAA